MQADMDSKEENLRDDFNLRLKESQARFADETKQFKAEVSNKLRKEYGKVLMILMLLTKINHLLDPLLPLTEDQIEKARRDKEEAVQDLERIHKRKLIDADTRLE